MATKCPECGQKEYRIIYKSNDEQKQINKHCDWCGWHTEYDRHGGWGMHTGPGKCYGRDVPKTIKHCGKNAPFIKYYDARAVYRCPICGALGYVNLWQDPERTITGEEVYWETRYDCLSAQVAPALCI